MKPGGGTNNGQKPLFCVETQNDEAEYEPISSVWERSDKELIEAMLEFYPTIECEPILDATYNTGRFWNGSSRCVWSMDIDY